MSNLEYKKAIAIFGYNNTRLYDVERIRELATKEKGAVLILIKQGITSLDKMVTPFYLDADPTRVDLSDILDSFAAENNLNVIGCLPFSDKGVVGASYAAQKLGLFHDNVETSHMMVDKNGFRILEAHYEPAAEHRYKKPFFFNVHKLEELFSIFDKYGSFFIKPSSEGNSRGCMKIESKADLLEWLKDHNGYIPQGVLCEEILSEGNEFSFDGVNNTYWITQKFTTMGSHRAEYQHILPAPISSRVTESIHNTLVPLLKHLGTSGGAFHHEFFLLPDKSLASVEPNRRPAGMWLWDLAEWSFDGFSPWKSWLEVHCGNPNIEAPLYPKYFSGVRGIISRASGEILAIDEKAMRKDLDTLFCNQLYRYMGFKKVGDKVTHAPKDNSDFLYFIATRNEQYEKVVRDLETAENIILEHIEVGG